MAITRATTDTTLSTSSLASGLALELAQLSTQQTPPSQLSVNPYDQPPYSGHDEDVQPNFVQANPKFNWEALAVAGDTNFPSVPCEEKV